MKPIRKSIPVDELKVTGINFVGRRVWVPTKTSYGFRSGIIERHEADNRMILRFPNGDVEGFRAEQVCIRLETPFIEALDAVQLGAVEGAEPYLARRDIAGQLIQQRVACRGYDAVPSAAIGFFDHQLETLQRVLEDPICRFILADEVGLGKTIEAGLVIRQTLLDDPSADIYVFAPSALVQQWRDELCQKFLLGDLLDAPRNRRSRIWVREHGDIFDTSIDVHTARLVVIDEAHQLIHHAMRLQKWQILSIICQNAQGLLLLSATPMRGDYFVLEALLHLVDPTAFPFGNHKEFAERIEDRTAELSEFDAVTSPFSSPDARAKALENIRVRHPLDPYVQDAVRDIAGGGPDSRVDALGHYLRETYRISRRMVRHRRGVGAATGFPTAGRNLAILEVASNASDQLLDEFLDRYREVIQEATNSDQLMWEAAQSALAGYVPLHEFLDIRLSANRTKGADDSAEVLLLGEYRARLLLNEDTRLQATVNETCRRVRLGQRVVAISGFHSHAIQFAEAVEAELGQKFQVLCHLKDTPQCLRNVVVEDFLFSDAGALLVGDASLEEGTNLQGSDALINIDLSLSPNRIEQRVGRLDRYSGEGSIRQSERPPDIVVIRPAGSSWCSAQVDTLARGIRVFSISVSTAQRFLAQWEFELRARLVLDGAKSLEQDPEDLNRSIDIEMAEVDELEAWESDTQQDFVNGLSAEHLDGYESRSASLALALLKMNNPEAGFPFRLVNAAGPTFSFALRSDVRLPTSLDERVQKLLNRPHTVSVVQALELGEGTPFRIGDPLVDWLARYLQADERGRAFVIIVRDAQLTSWDFWLRCDFLLEFDDVPLAATPQEDRRRLRRRGETFLPPRSISLWTNGSTVASGSLSAQLDGLLEEHKSESSIDWSELHLQVPAWQNECSDAATVARTSVLESDAYRNWVSEATTQVELDNARRQSVLGARVERLPTDAERISAVKESDLEFQLGALILQGVREPRLQLINCGALIRRPK